MKKFILITKSESCDDYQYFIEHPQKPTIKELKKFIKQNGNDTKENIQECIEIPNKFQKL
jgi:hypothetical protein